MDDFYDDLNMPPLGGAGLPPLPGGNNGINNPLNTQPRKKEPNRMDVINNLYRTVFGRAPDSNAVMYYMGLREIDENLIRKQMVESGEHAKIIEDSQKIPQLQKETQDSKEQVLILSKEIEDKKVEIENLNKLMYEKNQELLEMKQKLALQQKNPTQENPTANSSHTSPKKGLLKKIFS